MNYKIKSNTLLILQIKADNTDVYSVIADKNFPGLKLYDTDFLIPWNRTEITEYVVFDGHKADYGSGNAPISAFMFRVEEKGKHHYFMTAGRQRGEFQNCFIWAKISKLKKLNLPEMVI